MCTHNAVIQRAVQVFRVRRKHSCAQLLLHTQFYVLSLSARADTLGGRTYIRLRPKLARPVTFGACKMISSTDADRAMQERCLQSTIR